MQQNLPIVALESTIISHGMPFPQNLEVAREVEQMVRSHGAVPATIAILDGQIHVGLNPVQLESFALKSDVFKCSRRDLAFLISKRANAATTVATTMIIAHWAGIAVFATGGIGGVHRGAEATMDISADLDELATTPVAVVSAGAKAILDLPKTLELLETKGVPVIGYGTRFFPAFYTRTSGLQTPMEVADAAEAAAVLWTQGTLGLRAGLLIANPIPEEFELDPVLIETAIAQANMQAQQEGISGRDLTPFLLKKLNAMTEGKSQFANRALVLNNARVAAKIAASFQELKNAHA
jgi:pseudouridylate synthase